MRCVLIIHPDETKRRELRATMGEVEVLEAATREAALPVLRSKIPTIILSHHDGFRRLLRDLEHHVPGATRAVLVPTNDELMKRALVDAAAQGYEFLTIDERETDRVRSLVSSRASTRRSPSGPLTARFMVEGVPARAAVEELGNDGLGLRLEPGLPLERVAPGLLLSEASVWARDSVVMEPRPWRVRSAVQLRDQPQARVGISFAASPRSDEPAEQLFGQVPLRGLIRRAAASSQGFEVLRVDGVQRRVFGAARLDEHRGRLVLEEPAGRQPFHAGQLVRLGFGLSGRQFECVVSVVEASPDAVQLSEPEFLMRHHRRRSLRARASEGLEGSLDFVSPLSGERVHRPLIDLHPGGAAFLFDAAAETFPIGLLLRDVTIETNGHRVRCQAVVQGTVAVDLDDAAPEARRSPRRCGLTLRGLSDDGLRVLQGVLASVLAPEAMDGAEVPFDEIWALFCSQDVRFPDYPPDDPQSGAKLAATQTIARRAREGLFRSFVYRDACGELLGHTSALRPFSRTWLAQHLVVKAGYSRQTHVAQTLVTLAFDYGEAFDDIEYCRGLWRATNRWPARVFGGVSAKTMKPGYSCLTQYLQLRWPTCRALPPSRFTTRPVSREDFSPLLTRLRAIEDPVRLRSSDLDSEELLLATIGERYRASGLWRERHIDVIDGSSGPRGWVLMEEMTPGLIWMEMLNVFRVVLADPTDPEADELRLALVARGVHEARRRGRRFAEWHDSFDDSAGLARLGFTKLGVAMEYTGHRSLTREWNFQMAAIFDRLAAESHRRRPT